MGVIRSTGSARAYQSTIDEHQELLSYVEGKQVFPQTPLLTIWATTTTEGSGVVSFVSTGLLRGRLVAPIIYLSANCVVSTGGNTRLFALLLNKATIATFPFPLII